MGRGASGARTSSFPPGGSAGAACRVASARLRSTGFGRRRPRRPQADAEAQRRQGQHDQEPVLDLVQHHVA
jgi:hypothetical protein